MTENDLARVIYVNEQRRLLRSLQSFLADNKCYAAEVTVTSEKKHEIPKTIMEDFRALVNKKIVEINDEIKSM